MNGKSIVVRAIILLAILAAVIAGGFYYVHTAVAPKAPVGDGGSASQAGTPASASLSLSSPPATTTSRSLPPSPIASFNVSPPSGPVGTTVTIHGSGFGDDNTIEMGGLIGASMKGVASADGTTLGFAIPQSLGPNCNPGEACPQFLLLVTPRAYPITVITDGATEKVGTFTVTAK